MLNSASERVLSTRTKNIIIRVKLNSGVGVEVECGTFSSLGCETS